MRVVVIVNPESGRRGRHAETAADRLELVRRMLRDGADPGHDTADIQLTRSRGHGAELARAAVAQGADVVVAWGGDGTANEIAGPLIGTRTALGIVPAGSGNGLARGLGLPVDRSKALRLALAGPVGAIDTAMMGARHFLNIGGIGFDAVVALSFDRRGKRGLTSYVRNTFTEVWSYRPARYRIELDDGPAMHGTYQMVSFANAREYGNRLVLAPDANPRDGRLNAVIVDAGAALRQLWRARRLAFPSTRPAEGVHRVSVQRATISADRMQCHVDGEPFEATGTLEVTIRPATLLVRGLAPRDRLRLL